MTQVVKVPSIGVWLEMSREASIGFESVGHVVLTDDRVGVTLSFLRQHRLQLVYRDWTDAESCEVRF